MQDAEFDSDPELPEELPHAPPAANKPPAKQPPAKKAAAKKPAASLNQQEDIGDEELHLRRRVTRQYSFREPSIETRSISRQFNYIEAASSTSREQGYRRSLEAVQEEDATNEIPEDMERSLQQEDETFTPALHSLPPLESDAAISIMSLNQSPANQPANQPPANQPTELNPKPPAVQAKPQAKPAAKTPAAPKTSSKKQKTLV
jgi:hypothetical protein